MVRLTRATFFSFALMLGVFALWALSGFGYPSAPLPTALNVASKILAFVTALTLFLPLRPAPGQTPQLVRPRRRLLAGAACGVVVLPLVTAGCSSAAQPAGASAKTPGHAAGPLWLCQPGRAPDPCAGNPAVGGHGERHGHAGCPAIFRGGHRSSPAFTSTRRRA